MAKKKRRVIELTEFKTKNNIPEKEFLKISSKIQKFLEDQPGFEHRMLVFDMKSKWTEIIQWRNVDYAKEARSKLKEAPEGKQYFKNISPKTIKSIYPELIKMF